MTQEMTGPEPGGSGPRWPGTGQRYAYLPIDPHPAYVRVCAQCEGRGVTGDRYEMPTDTGPILLVDVICDACTGCGNGDPAHMECAPDAHAYPDDDFDDDDQRDDGAECLSCGSGRGWNAVQAFPDADTMVVLRVPCGCSESRLVLTDAP